MKELPPDQFNFGNYNAEIPYTIMTDYDKLLTWLQSHNLIGYSRNPSIRPRTESVAVLIETEEFGEYWSHIPNEVFDKLIG